MDNKIKELEATCNETIEAVEDFPQDKREVPLFDKWSLKDVVAHITGWNKQRIFELNAFLDGKAIRKISDFDSFNENSVNGRKYLPWEDVFKEFVDSCKDLVGAFNSIPIELVDMEVWPESTMTPRTWLQIDLDHMKLEHLPEIKKISDSI
jgi:hypothetical protein